jgi:uncharacterized membrane protein
MFVRRLVPLAAVLALLFHSWNAFADWTIVNRSPYEVWVAIAWDSGNGFTSSGWWKLSPCGGARRVLNGAPHATGAFVYAMRTDTRESVLPANNFLFCVADRGFNFTSENRQRGICVHSVGRLVDFMQTEVRTQGDTTTTVRGTKKPSDRVCID